MKAIIQTPEGTKELEIVKYSPIEPNGIILYEHYPGCTQTYPASEVTIKEDDNEHTEED